MDGRAMDDRDAAPQPSRAALSTARLRRFFASMRARILLVVLLGVIPPLAAAFMLTVGWQQSLDRKTEADAASLARHVAAEQERMLMVVRETLHALSALPIDHLHEPEECGRLLAAHLSTAVRYENLAIVDLGGRLLCGAGTLTDARHILRRSYVRHAADTGRFVVEDDVASGRCILGLATPLRAPGGPVRGVVFATLDLTRAGMWPPATPVPEGASVALIDEEGAVLARLPGSTRTVASTVEGTPVFATVAAKRREGLAAGADLDGVHRVLAFHRIAGTDGNVAVVAGIAPAVAAAPARQTILYGWLAALCGGLLAVVAAWVTADVFVVRPVNTLALSAQRLRRGDLATRTGLDYGSSELCQLAQTFDGMASALEARQADTDRARDALRAAHGALEEQVRERTRELVGANAALRTALAQREEVEATLTKLSSALAQAGDSVMITDGEGFIEYVNPAFERLTGYTAAEVLGTTPRILKSGMHDEAFYAGVWRALTAGEIVRTVFVNRTKTGNLYWEEKTITPIRDDAGHVTHFAAAARDITAQRQAEQELRRSREQLRELTAHVEGVREQERTRIGREVHDELGQALTALKFELCRLAASPASGAPVVDAAKGMVGLVDDTIDAVRRIATELRPAVLDDLGLEAAIEWQAHDFETRTGIRCDFTGSDPAGEPSRDVATAAFRILQEALTNVVRHAEASKVEITLDNDDRMLTLRIHDDGRGISETEVAAGRSLGLLGMRERARLLGGRVTISAEPGGGTTVTLEVPAAEHAADTGATPVAPEERS